VMHRRGVSRPTLFAKSARSRERWAAGAA
jgi:hypothetical protein